MVIILNLALPERPCYEPLASTHPDTQGNERGYFAWERRISFDMRLTASG
jgi:hypothetical protein